MIELIDFPQQAFLLDVNPSIVLTPIPPPPDINWVDENGEPWVDENGEPWTTQ